MVLRRRIKKYAELLEEEQKKNKLGSTSPVFETPMEDTREHSVTRKLGGTELGDRELSDTLEIGSNIAQSIEGYD